MKLKNHHEAPKPVRVSLEAILREFNRCSNQYRPIFHEMMMPTCDLSEHSVKAVCQSFQNAYSDQFNDPWDEWHGPPGLYYFGRFFGDSEGLFEFQQLAESSYLVMRDIQPSLPDHGYHGWINLLYEMARGYPTPLLQCTLDRWNDKAIKDLTEAEYDSIATPEGGGASYPLYPLHFKLRQNVFTASMVAIELTLDDEGALLVGEVTEGLPFTFPQPRNDIDQSGFEFSDDQIVSLRDDALHGPVKAFTYIEYFERWHLEIDLSNETQTVSFDKCVGCDIYNVLFRHPGDPLSALKLLQLTKQADLPTVEQEAALNQKSSKEPRLDRKSVRNYQKRIAAIDQELPKTVNPKRRQELEDERTIIEKELRTSKDFRREPRKLGSDDEDTAINLVKGQISRCCSHIAKKLAEFPAFSKKCIRRQDNEWTYEPENWPIPAEK